MGEYLISPSTRALRNGWFGGAVAIRSAGTERVLRLTRLFRDPVAAADFARNEALRWLAMPSPAAGA